MKQHSAVQWRRPCQAVSVAACAVLLCTLQTRVAALLRSRCLCRAPSQTAAQRCAFSSLIVDCGCTRAAHALPRCWRPAVPGAFSSRHAKSRDETQLHNALEYNLTQADGLAGLCNSLGRSSHHAAVIVYQGTATHTLVKLLRPACMLGIINDRRGMQAAASRREIHTRAL